MLVAVVAAVVAATVSAPTAAASALSFCDELGGQWNGQYCQTSVRSERNAVRDIKVAIPAEIVDDPVAGPVVREYLTTLVDNWKRVGVSMVADSFGEGNYEIYRRRQHVVGGVPRDLSRRRSGLQQRLPHLHLRHVRRTTVAAVGSDEARRRPARRRFLRWRNRLSSTRWTRRRPRTNPAPTHLLRSGGRRTRSTRAATRHGHSRPTNLFCTCRITRWRGTPRSTSPRL